MTEAEKNIINETQGLLHSCGYKLQQAEGDTYQIVKCGSGEVLASGTLEVCRNAAAYMAASGKFEPDPTAKGPEAYKAGLAMSEKLKKMK